MRTIVTPAKRLQGEAVIPGDKSISHRGVMLGAISKGNTRLTNFLSGSDCISTINAFKQMGIEIHMAPGGVVTIKGNGLHGLKAPCKTLEMGNSGTTTRLMMGILAGQSFESILDGDDSLRKRPMKRVILPLMHMGSTINEIVHQDYLPLSIKGGSLKGIEYTMPVASAQVKSSIILATLFADSSSIIHQPAQSRNHTEVMLGAFGAKIDSSEKRIIAHPTQELYGQDIIIPGDISSAAYLLTAAIIIPKSELILKRVGINDTRTGILDVYKKMGAKIDIHNVTTSAGEPYGDIRVQSSQLNSVEISGDIIPRLIDEIPIIALAATQAHGTTVIRDAQELKVKESNRIDTVVMSLSAMGADIKGTEDGLVINGPTPLKGTILNCHMDHRIAMMSAIAGLIAKGETICENSEWVDVSFPNFFDIIKGLQA